MTGPGLVAQHSGRGRHGTRICVGEAAQELLRDDTVVHGQVVVVVSSTVVEAGAHPSFAVLVLHNPD